MLTDVLSAANRYTDGLNHVQARKDQWLKKSAEIKNHLKQIADYLNANATFKAGFYVDAFHAFNEEINGTCAEMPSVTFRSGEIDMGLVFRNNMGQTKCFNEKGFQLTFNPTITGQILLLLLPHHSDLVSKDNKYINLAIVNDLSELTDEFVEEAVQKALEIAFHTSFAGMAEQDPAAAADGHNYTPIGFKRYESTEHVTDK